MEDEDKKEESQELVRLTKDELAERRLKVHQLLVRGLTQREIGEELGISQPTVARDIAIVKKESTENIKNYNKEGFIADTVTGYDDIWAECWKIANGTEDKELKIKAMTAARLALNDKRKALQDSGIIKKEHAGGGSQIHLNLIAGISDDDLDKTALGLIQAALKTELQPPVEDDYIDIEEDEKEEENE